MKKILPLVIAALLTGCYASNQTKTGGAAQAHMGHVSGGWKDTPNGAGLLPTAIDEAQIAAQHAGFAASKPGDLSWMKLHTTHVMHAIDPASVAKGPGKGYGLVKAASGAAKHIDFAAGSKDASANVKAHSVHVATAAQNAVDWANEVMELARQVQGTSSADQAAPKVKRIAELTQQIINGLDANGDGQVTWVKGEGGLMQANKHMGVMYKGEGLPAPGS